MRRTVACAIAVWAAASGCVGLSAPIITGAFEDGPEVWDALAPVERYERAWAYHRHGVDYAYNASIRVSARLLATGVRRAAEGLEVCATVVADAGERAAMTEVASGYRRLERQARNGRLLRTRRQLRDLEAQASAFRPGQVTLVQPPPTGPPAGTPLLRTTDTPVVGTVLRKRMDVVPGPDGEQHVYVLVLLKKGGAQVEHVVDHARWKAAIIGDQAPAATPTAPPAKDAR